MTSTSPTETDFFDLSKLFTSNIAHMAARARQGHADLSRLDPDTVTRAFAQTPAALMDAIGQPGRTVAERYTFGLALGLRSDPRIRPFDPAMVDVPGGAVTLGRSRAAVERAFDSLRDLDLDLTWLLKEVPDFAVTLEPYRIGVYPVTHQEYLRFLDANPHHTFPSSWTNGRFPEVCGNHPVWSVGREDAASYAAWLSRETGRAFRLPTEYEWEYAAAGPLGYAYPWGDAWEQGRANTAEARLFGTTPVGMWPLGASPFGCQDMAGNVMEWVDGGYHPYPGGEVVRDWYVEADSHHPLVRGGGFDGHRDLARCHRRFGVTSWATVGFRLAETVLAPNTPR